MLYFWVCGWYLPLLGQVKCIDLCQGEQNYPMQFKGEYMINIKLFGHNYIYEVEEIVNLFFDNKEIYDYKIKSFLETGQNITAKSEVYLMGKLISKAELVRENRAGCNIELRKQSKRLIKASIFKALKKVIDKYIPWGILTGIRPTKIVHEMMKHGYSREKIYSILKDEYEIQPEKVELLINISHKELNILDGTPINSVSIYIGIPFCPTRCLYCSFTSNPVIKYAYLMNDYIKALMMEIESVKSIVKNNGWNVQTIYIGGGTPTALDIKQLEILLDKIDREFNIQSIKETTIEAGRPDTINREKLELIKKYGIERISINPQTMNQETLGLIGRMHTPDDIIEKFHLAREIGFKNINMDIIAGLPEENESHILKTMKELSTLNPDNITVHTLAVKRASSLRQSIAEYTLSKNERIQKMLDITQDYASKMGMYPYYMYRQKNMLGNFENVGYCKENKECIYNIQIMEEKQTILALGAGGISKVIDLSKDKVERIFNVKNVEEYIKRINEMIERKKDYMNKP